MANLLGANIGTNYKGFLNLDSTINTPLDATLRSITDGMGNASPLQLSTDQVGILRTIALTAGASNQRLFNNVYTINNSGAQTGTLTGYFLNATETALNGMTHMLMDLQVGGVSKFSVNRFGSAIMASGSVCSDFNATLLRTTNVYFGSSVGSIRGTAQGVIILEDALGTSFNRLQFGGTTSSFPAIKRNGAAIDFRLADDSGFCGINANQLGIGTNTPDSKLHVLTSGNTSFRIDIGNTGNGDNYIDSGTASSGVTHMRSKVNIVGAVKIGADASPNASSILDIESTTKGFLLPRMTEAQILAIVTPANGLIVYNTNQLVPCFYDGTGWKRLVHLAM